jgi:hypothetical protein
MSTAIRMNREELRRRRQQLLDEVHMNYDQLRERAAAYTLRAEERVAYETIRSIDYLLGDDR